MPFQGAEFALLKTGSDPEEREELRTGSKGVQFDQGWWRCRGWGWGLDVEACSVCGEERRNVSAGFANAREGLWTWTWVQRERGDNLGITFQGNKLKLFQAPCSPLA